MEPNEKEKVFAKKACFTCSREFDPDISICPDDGTQLTSLVDDQLVGSVLDNKYEILEVIGGGGMGLVYKARHRLMNRIVAIKMLHRQLVSSTDTLKRFRLEAEAASCLSLPNILTVYDFGLTPEGQPFMVMDYLEGTSLADVLEAEGHLSVDRALSIFIQACGGLAHAHEKGVLHRDIKPSNIMLVRYGDQADFVKIVDFGIAKILNQGQGDLTKSGEVYGSPSYMSPEQCRGKETDARSDIYAMGCVMYRALTGNPLFTGDDIIELLFKQVSESPQPFEKICPEHNLPSDLQAIVFKALAKDPKDRYPTMAEFKEALEQLKDKRAGKLPDLKAVESPTPLWKRSGEGALAGKPNLVSDSVQGAQSAPIAKATEPEVLPGVESARDHAQLKDAPAIRSVEAKPGATIARSSLLRKKLGEKHNIILVPAAFVFCVSLGALYFSWSHPAGNANADKTTDKTPFGAIDVKSGASKSNPGEAQSQAGGQTDADLSSLLSAGSTAYDAKQFDLARSSFSKAVALSQTKFGGESIEIADAYLGLGKTDLAVGQYATAESFAQSSIRIRESKYGLESRDLVDSLTVLSDIYRHLNSLELSESTLKRAIAIQEKAMGPNDLTVADLDFALAQTLQDAKDSKEAEAMSKKALSIKKATLGPDSPQIAEIQKFIAANDTSGESAAKSGHGEHPGHRQAVRKESSPRHRHAYSSYGF